MPSSSGIGFEVRRLRPIITSWPNCPSSQEYHGPAGRFTRGLWLVFVEWFVVATAFTIAPGGIAQAGGFVVVPLQVTWAIGASMIVLALAQRLGRTVCPVAVL